MYKNKLLAVFVLSISIISFAGCTETMYNMRVALGSTMLPKGASFSGPIAKVSNEAVVYIYRPIGWAETPDVIINNKNMSFLTEGAFFVETIKPGNLRILVQNNPAGNYWSFGPIGVDVSVGAGERRYYRIGTGIGGILLTPWIGGYTQEMKIEEIPEYLALQELSKLRSMH